MKIGWSFEKKNGFTLIELLVVVAIIGILATVVIINVAKARGKAGNAKAISEMSTSQKTAVACLLGGGVLVADYGVGGDGPIYFEESVPHSLYTLGTNICTPSTIAKGLWPMINSVPSSRGGNWETGTGQLTSAGSDFVFYSHAYTDNDGARAAGDFEIACTSTGCVKKIATSPDVYTTTGANW